MIPDKLKQRLSEMSDRQRLMFICGVAAASYEEVEKAVKGRHEDRLPANLENIELLTKLITGIEIIVELGTFAWLLFSGTLAKYPLLIAVGIVWAFTNSAFAILAIGRLRKKVFFYEERQKTFKEMEVEIFAPVSSK